MAGHWYSKSCIDKCKEGLWSLGRFWKDWILAGSRKIRIHAKEIWRHSRQGQNMINNLNLESSMSYLQ